MTRKALRRAVFLDRDGTINREIEYLYRPEDFAWIPGTPEAIRRLNDAGLLVLVVTNQAGVARGYYTEDDVRRLHDFIQQELRGYGAHIDAFYYCPFHPEGAVAAYRRADPCRKPGAGMYEQALAAWSIDPARSFAVGDRNSDLVPARRLGLRTFLVETGYGAEEKHATRAAAVVPDLAAAAEHIIDLCATTR